MTISVGDAVAAACVFEVRARKPGNVSFGDHRYTDYMLSAAEVTIALQHAGEEPLGTTVLTAIQSTRRTVEHNTNLGIVLLLAPLAAVPMHRKLSEGVL